MKKVKTRQMVVCLVGLALCKVSFAGCFPLIPAYFAAAYMEDAGRMLLTIFMFAGMAVFLPVTVMVKYTMALIVAAVVIRLAEWANKGCFTWVGAMAAGMATSLVSIFGGMMNLKNQQSVVFSILEGLFVFGATMLLSRVLHLFVTWKPQTCVTEDIAEERSGEKLKTYAQSFQGLSHIFSQMNVQHNDFTSEEMGQIQNEITNKMCTACDQCAICWEADTSPMYTYLSQMIQSIRMMGHVDRDAEMKIKEYCPYAGSMIEEAVKIFEKAQLNMSWYNRLLENREVIAEQLDAMAYIMEDCASVDQDISKTCKGLLSDIRFRAKERGIIVYDSHLFEKTNHRWQLIITAAMKSGCIPVKELTKVVNTVLEKKMIPQKDTKSLIGKEQVCLIYEEDTYFQSIQGVARMTKDGAQISGDNFSFLERENGQMIMSLSDGMGSGSRACKESETVIELMEKFLEAGFSVETAIRMMNSAMVIRGENDLFSTIDISALDLYDGTCKFYKIGASTTFIKHKDSVECLVSTSLPVGVYYRLEIEQSQKQLSNGDFLVMVSDGVLEYLHVPNPEETMQEILESINTNHSGVLAKKILERVLLFTGGKVPDDMTILTTAVWEK